MIESLRCCSCRFENLVKVSQLVVSAVRGTGWYIGPTLIPVVYGIGWDMLHIDDLAATEGGYPAPCFCGTLVPESRLETRIPQ